MCGSVDGDAEPDRIHFRNPAGTGDDTGHTHGSIDEFGWALERFMTGLHQDGAWLVLDVRLEFSTCVGLSEGEG